MNKGDWVASAEGFAFEVGRIIDAFDDDGARYLNICLYSPTSGERIGRSSPPEGGPTTYEPACPATNWRRIRKPAFPIEHRIVQRGARVAGEWGVSYLDGGV